MTHTHPTAKGWFCWIFLLLFLLSFSLSAQKQKSGQKRNQSDTSSGNRGGRAKLTLAEATRGNMVWGAPTNHSITASIILERGDEAFIEYSTRRGRYDHKTATSKAGDEGLIEIRLDGLTENTTYYGRLHLRREGEKSETISAESRFCTQKKPGSSFSFGVQGDSHPEREGKMFHPDLYRQTIRRAAEHQTDFYVLMGDDFSMDRLMQHQQVSRDRVERIYRIQRHYWGEPGTNTPLFLVNGNHEQAAKYLLDGTADNVSVLAANARKKYFPLPEPMGFYSGDRDTVGHVGWLKDYYAFEWGDALFVVIDPYWHSDIPVDNQPGVREQHQKKNPWGITLGETQYRWFKQTLESSKARFKFVFSHHVLGTGRGGVERSRYFEWGGYNPDGTWVFDSQRPGWESPIHQLMVKNKVTVFFQGHDHLYARQERDGVVYQSVPNPADNTYTAFNKEAYTSGKILPNSGYLNVTVSPLEVKVEYVRSYLEADAGRGSEVTGNYTYTIKK